MTWTFVVLGAKYSCVRRVGAAVVEQPFASVTETCASVIITNKLCTSDL